MSPVRAHGSLFNLNKMKELAQLRQQTNTARTSRTVERGTNSSDAESPTLPGKKSANGGKQEIAGKNQSINMVQHAMSSLSGVRDSKKFGEVLDKMFVPTVQAYR